MDGQPQPQQPINQPQHPSYEQYLGQFAFRQATERSFLDKILGRKEVFDLQNLMNKDDLSRADMLRMLYMLNSVELKLSNLGEYDRYLLGKYFTWVRELVKHTEILYDYMDHTKDFGWEEKDKKEIEDGLMRIKQMMIHNVKFAADIYLFIIRSSLGLTALGFDTLTTNRFEYDYGPYGGGAIQPIQPQQKSWLPWRR